MLKKFLITLISFIISINVFAQRPIPAEIKTKKIKKIITTHQEQGSEISTKSETYYDAQGNDTAEYSGGLRTWYYVIEYNKNVKPTKITEYNADGTQKGITIYSYKPDGSYTSTFTDEQFGMKDVDLYNKDGQILQSTIPDGTVIKYVYNSKKLLIKKFSIPKNGGVKFTEQFTYDAKNKMTSKKREGDYPGTEKYEYDSKGLLKKIEFTSEGYSGSSSFEYIY
ncbi:MAG: hypothetical protein V4556_06110 [Bacteroidota bacterium]